MRRSIVRWIAIPIAATALLCLLPIGIAAVLDAWKEHDPASLRMTSIWARDLFGVTSRETLVMEAAWEPDGGTYIRWALRRGADPAFELRGLRAIDSIMYDLGGGCEPPLGPFEILARSGIELDRGARGGLIGFAARECRRPDLVHILLAAGADPVRVGGSDGLVHLLGDAVYGADARNLWTWLLDHGAAPCAALGSTDDPASMLRRLTARGLPDLAARAEAACAAESGGK